MKTIVVPAYNEERTVGGVVSALVGLGYPVIVVNDGSSDRTAELSVAAGAHVVSHSINRGLGAAIGTGIAAALRSGAEIVVTFDADGQHRAADLVRLTAPLERGEADVSIGIRTLDRHRMPKHRRLANWMGNALTFALFGIWVRDSQSGLRAFTREAASRLDLRCDRMEISSEIIREIRHCRLRLAEVPIRPDYSEYSLSKGQSVTVGLKTAGKLLLHRVMR